MVTTSSSIGQCYFVSEDGENLLPKDPIAFIATGKYWVNNHAHVLAAAPGYDLAFYCFLCLHLATSRATV